jgi:hypothetical protein
MAKRADKQSPPTQFGKAQSNGQEELSESTKKQLPACTCPCKTKKVKEDTKEQSDYKTSTDRDLCRKVLFNETLVVDSKR